MNPIRTIIVDDEPIARRGMAKLVARRPELLLAGSFATAAEAEEFLRSGDTDLILLDIEMPGLDGIDFARQLNGRPLVVFTTAYSEYVSESYEVQAADYLLKPIDADRFGKAVERVAARLNALPTDTITVRADRRQINIPLREIEMVEGVKDYVKLHLSGRRITTRLTIKRIGEMLPAGQFLRIHKSYIVNINKVLSFSPNAVELPGRTLPIGQSYRADVFPRLSARYPEP